MGLSSDGRRKQRLLSKFVLQILISDIVETMEVLDGNRNRKFEKEGSGRTADK